jgi:hypothetical protein
MMLTRSNISKFAVILATFFAGTLIASKPVQSQERPFSRNQYSSSSRSTIAALANGKYQFCTQAEPKDWRDGAGVCLNFSKTGDRIDGYYAYPHSGNYICIRGQVNGNRITGNALAVLWENSSSENSPSEKIPESEFKWDEEGHLTLSQGKIISSAKNGDGRVDRVIFSKANLNATGFLQYSQPRMTPPSQLCKW